MKKIISIALAAFVAVVSCQKNELSEPAQCDAVLHATIDEEEPTRTVMDERNNIRWSEGDQLVAFMKSSYGHKYQVKPSFVGKVYADFSKVSSSGGGDDLSAGVEYDHNIVYYPYSETAECERAGSNYALNVSFPAEQTYVKGSFAEGSFPMVAVSSDNNIIFKNVCGGMKLRMTGTQKVASIVVRGKNSERLSGSATVTAYPGGAAPSVVMASAASNSVRLNCPDGVQLNETTATEFIISLPPVLFSKGFTLNVTDTDGKSYTVGTDRANTVLRSSMLVMPVFNLGDAPVTDEEDAVVERIMFDRSALHLMPDATYSLIVAFVPYNVADKSLTWSSDNTSVAKVDKDGLITAVSDGKAVITAVAVSGVSASCTVTVESPASTTLIDYMDEYGISHGPGTLIGGTVWAPVNCGYHADDYKYGKLYQWGRKHGQGYNSYNSTDKTYPSGENLVPAPVSQEEGLAEENKDKFFYLVQLPAYDWCIVKNDWMWNSGTEDAPVKTASDPCPDGWRVPTYKELNALSKNSVWASHEGQNGRWFSGEYFYSESSPKVFFPAGGYRNNTGSSSGRGSSGYYGLSKPSAEVLRMTSSSNYISNISPNRADGCSIRCVQYDPETELKPVSRVNLDRTAVVVLPGQTVRLNATAEPSTDALSWSSDTPAVATVDQSGNVSALSDGTAVITALSSGGAAATCKVTVSTPVSAKTDYVDEYGEKHGKGIAIGSTVWAPVNCGYHAEQYKYGKLYQWGRKHGQGYDGDDESYPSGEDLVPGPVMPGEGLLDENAGKFFYISGSATDWSKVQDDKMWNSGTEDAPEKTASDPCPDGWRVPTYKELNTLSQNSVWASHEGQDGRWFSGEYFYSESSPRVFFPAGGYRNNTGSSSGRGSSGCYGLSKPSGDVLRMTSSSNYISTISSNRANGYSIRCVEQ